MLIPKGALLVSCQARADNPLHGPVYMSAMAQAAEAGGAKGIRANGEADVAAIRAVTQLPLIGISKVWDDRFPVYITPGFEQAEQIAKAGADIIGIDATPRPRNGEPVARRAREVALGAYRALDCRDLARVDLRCDASGEPCFLEVNPLPGLHPTYSDLPILAGRSGISYSELLGQVVEATARRWGLWS